MKKHLWIALPVLTLACGCAMTAARKEAAASILDATTNGVHVIETKVVPLVPSPYTPLAETGLALVGALVGALSAKLHSSAKATAQAEAAKSGQTPGEKTS